MDRVLFSSPAGDVTCDSLANTLRSVGAAECDVLYIHTDMTFGLPAKGIRRNELLQDLFDILQGLGVETLVFPTFTFSFCNGEIYDVQNSKTPMGALNEFVRKSGRGVRTLDPLLSVYVIGNRLNLVDNLGRQSIGKDSNYDRLHSCGKEVRFLFFGADMRQCFTYVHYLEAIIGIPYRYNRTFTGSIIDDGRILHNQEVELYSLYANARLNPVPVVYNAMKECGHLSIDTAGSGSICCFKEKDAWNVLARLLHEEPLILTDGNFNPEIKDMTYQHGSRIVSVK